MALTILQAVIKEDGNERLDQFAGRLYGFTDGAVEALLDANPGLAALGAVPPARTRIRVPRVEAPASADTTVKPWS